MKTETKKYVGFRLDEQHRTIIRKYARRWKCGESEAVRRIIAKYNIAQTLGELANKDEI